MKKERPSKQRKFARRGELGKTGKKKAGKKFARRQINSPRGELIRLRANLFANRLTKGPGEQITKRGEFNSPGGEIVRQKANYFANWRTGKEAKEAGKRERKGRMIRLWRIIRQKENQGNSWRTNSPKRVNQGGWRNKGRLAKEGTEELIRQKGELFANSANQFAREAN